MLNFLNNTKNFIERLNNEIKIKISEKKINYCLYVKLKQGDITKRICLHILKDKFKEYSNIETYKLYLVSQIIKEIILLYENEE